MRGGRRGVAASFARNERGYQQQRGRLGEPEGDGRMHPAELLAPRLLAGADGLLDEAPDGAVRGDDAEHPERGSDAQGNPQSTQRSTAVHDHKHPAAKQQQQAQAGEGDIDYRRDLECPGVAAGIVCCHGSAGLWATTVCGLWALRFGQGNFCQCQHGAPPMLPSPRVIILRTGSTNGEISNSGPRRYALT